LSGHTRKVVLAENADTGKQVPFFLHFLQKIRPAKSDFS